ncbi:MAG: HAMP domain-containing sensor histidine kinase [Myxococcota bacterium]
MPTVRRPSAAFVMGWMAGTLAAISFVPTAVPLIWQIIRAEETLGLRHTLAAAYSIQATIRNDQLPTLDTMRLAALEHLSVRVPGKDRLQFGTALSDALIAQVCASDSESEVVQSSRRQMWAVACIERDEIQVVAAVPLDPRAPAQRVMGLVVLLALFVGIVTSLGILRLLRPLSEISGALARVGAGERGVSVTQTGLAELDALVDRLNAAARSVDDREDAILARIAVVQEMARIVAHEIRNPLQSLELLTSLIVSEDDPKERKDIGDSLHVEIRTLEQVVHRLLTESTARGSLRLQLTTQSIAPLVQQVVALRRPQANTHGARLSTGSLSWTEVPFDQALIKRSIENLVLNALQAVPKNLGEIRISVLDDAGDLVIVVEDNGPGVPTQLVDHIFEPNVSGRAGGTGLGLALVKGVIEAHRGYIRYGRSPLGGARFEARIPLVQEATEEAP